MTATPKPHTLCARKGCRRHATHHLGFSVKVVGEAHKDSVTGGVALSLCHAHAIQATQEPAELVVTDTYWRTYVLPAFAAHKRGVPDRNTVRLTVKKGRPDGRRHLQ